mmetsp:Transcript_119538/g.283846  ORF Transcript_119538/g.283846 Transcript_119538/m.283846 type:complete len:443 (+) Transcript_119538:78-1406(+)
MRQAMMGRLGPQGTLRFGFSVWLFSCSGGRPCLSAHAVKCLIESLSLGGVRRLQQGESVRAATQQGLQVASTVHVAIPHRRSVLAVAAEAEEDGVRDMVGEQAERPGDQHANQEGDKADEGGQHDEVRAGRGCVVRPHSTKDSRHRRTHRGDGEAAGCCHQHRRPVKLRDVHIVARKVRISIHGGIAEGMPRHSGVHIRAAPQAPDFGLVQADQAVTHLAQGADFVHHRRAGVGILFCGFAHRAGHPVHDESDWAHDENDQGPHRQRPQVVPAQGPVGLPQRAGPINFLLLHWRVVPNPCDVGVHKARHCIAEVVHPDKRQDKTEGKPETFCLVVDFHGIAIRDTVKTRCKEHQTDRRVDQDKHLPRRGQGRLREDRWDVASAFPAGLHRLEGILQVLSIKVAGNVEHDDHEQSGHANEELEVGDKVPQISQLQLQIHGINH